MKAEVSIESARGCGFRKPGVDGVGIYLMGGHGWHACGRLPIPLHSCRACGRGIKPARGWTWVYPHEAFELEYCAADERLCLACLFGEQMPERAGLIWVGEKYYPSPDAFMRESMSLGISRKIAAIPRDFVLGETVIYLAHRSAIFTPPDPSIGRDMSFGPGLFSAFIPERVDLVVQDAEHVPERALKLASTIAEQHGEAAVRIVQVLRQGVDTQQALPIIGET